MRIGSSQTTYRRLHPGDPAPLSLHHVAAPTPRYPVACGPWVSCKVQDIPGHLPPYIAEHRIHDRTGTVASMVRPSPRTARYLAACSPFAAEGWWHGVRRHRAIFLSWLFALARLLPLVTGHLPLLSRPVLGFFHLLPMAELCKGSSSWHSSLWPFWRSREAKRSLFFGKRVGMVPQRLTTELCQADMQISPHQPHSALAPGPTMAAVAHGRRPPATGRPVASTPFAKVECAEEAGKVTNHHGRRDDTNDRSVGRDRTVGVVSEGQRRLSASFVVMPRSAVVRDSENDGCCPSNPLALSCPSPGNEASRTTVAQGQRPAARSHTYSYAFGQYTFLQIHILPSQLFSSPGAGFCVVARSEDDDRNNRDRPAPLSVS